MITKGQILKELKLNNVWNKIHTCFGFKVATVMWHTDHAWKIVTTDNFDQISDRDNKEFIVAEFYQQKDLCEYLFNKLNNNH